MSTALLPVLHDAFPGMEIGFLTGSYSRHIVDPHPLVARVHVIDHWYLSRSAAPRWRRAVNYLRALPALVREIRAEHYDIAVDVRAWYPNLVPLPWLAGIPERVAYGRVGGRPLLTLAPEYTYHSRHEIAHQLELLRAIGVAPGSLAKAWPVLAPPQPSALAQARRAVGSSERYRILHPSASSPARDWPVAHWQALARELSAHGITPVVTGSGQAAAAVARAICSAASGCVNTVDRLSWDGLIALIAGAEAVYAVETSVGHAASALRRPVISIYGGMADPVQWAPLGAAVATRALPCHPCISKAGCAARPCLSMVSVEDVRDAARAAMSA